MFKEKYLLFRGLEGSNNKDAPKVVAEKPKTKVENPALASQADDMAELLTVETDAVIAQVERDSEFTKQAETYFAEKILPELKKYYPNLPKVYLEHGDLVENGVMPLLKKGYEVGKPYAFYLTKERVVLVNKDKSMREARFEFKDYNDNLNFPLQNKEKPVLKTNPEESAENYFYEQILPIIENFKPDFNLDNVGKNYLINEQIIPVLAEGYKANDSYTVVDTETGFQLENSKDTQDFNLDNYDDQLEPIVKERSKPKAISEHLDLPSGEHVEHYVEIDEEERERIQQEKDKIMAEKFEEQVGMLQSDSPMDIDAITNQIHEISNKCPQLKELNDQLISYVNALDKKVAEGYRLVDARKIVNEEYAASGIDLDFEHQYEVVDRSAEKSDDYETQAAFDLVESFFEKWSDSLPPESHNHGPSDGDNSHEHQDGDGHDNPNDQDHFRKNVESERNKN